jgi:hypothetical protein
MAHSNYVARLLEYSEASSVTAVVTLLITATVFQ